MCRWYRCGRHHPDTKKPDSEESGFGQRLARRLRELGLSHEELIALAGDTAAFIEGPHDERLASTAITCGEDAGEVGHVLLVLGLDVGAAVAASPSSSGPSTKAVVSPASAISS